MQILVIGGGPAGMLAAGMAAQAGGTVCLAEKNEKTGMKLRITGKGRCNLTNACSHEDLLQNVVHNPQFLQSAFRGFSTEDVMRFMEAQGVPLKVERGNRVFPVSDRAEDVVKALRKWLDRSGVRVVKATAGRLIVRDGVLRGVQFGAKKVAADAVVLATGGMSYPQTGSTGDGYRMAAEVGHTIVTPRPSLVPLVCKERYNLAGLSLKNIGFSIQKDGKTIYTDFGEMLFTHDGVSGPVVLSASAHMQEEGKYRLSIDLKPALTEDMMDKRLLRDFEKYAKKDFVHALDDLLPKRLIETVVSKTGISPHKKAGSITRAERQAVSAVIKGFAMQVEGFRPIREAIVTAGGIETKEINPKTMESKLIRGLYFAGEIIDVDAYTGGFNLQIAFATGFAAGTAIGRRIRDEQQ
ncbi:MAG: NAD(P)/FAD-dependent oxidoreductase [Clostridia bacterium]|nr:NAD(P)/FAD-dependent oxidoreductase [Clostridia bacterium]